MSNFKTITVQLGCGYISEPQGTILCMSLQGTVLSRFSTKFLEDSCGSNSDLFLSFLPVSDVCS